MKKKIIVFGVIFAVLVFAGFKIANACTAEVTCSNGEKISCYGTSECLAGPKWVRCDQNQTVKCDDFKLE